MDSIVYGNLRIELLAEHGGKIQRTTLQAKPPAIHARPRSLVPSGPARLAGRDAEVATAQAVSAGEAIEFHAACGYGKSTLLRHLAARAGAEQTAAVVYLHVGGQRGDDLLQRLVDALYTADRPFKPTPEQRAQLLAGARALVLLDDVALGPAQLREVLDALPGCAVVVGSDRPVLGRGRSIALPGLPDDVALALLRRDLGRELTGPERADAERLCQLVGGQPLHLRQAAALVREGRHSFADLARAAEGDVFALDRLSVNALSEQERRVLAVLALAAGALLPTELVGCVTDLAGVWGVLDSLHRRGLVEQEQDRFGLPICHAADYRALLLRYLGLAQAARELATWLQRQAWSGQQAQSAAAAALQIIGYAAQRGQWPAVVRLVQAIEPVLALAGHWEAWRQVLERGLEAAQAVGDIAAEAHLAHQLGTLEFAVDHLDRARQLWQRALELREELGDQAGAAVTRANLALLEPPPARPRRSRRRRPSKRAIASAVVAGLAALAFLIPVASSIQKDNPPSTTAVVGPLTSRTSPTPTSPTPTSPTPTHVTVGSVSASSPSYEGDCPVTITFTGTIAVDRGPVKVTYRWIRSDGATGPVETISFSGSGAQGQKVGTTWTLGSPGLTYSGWEAIKLLTPTESTSNQAGFTISCTQPPPRVTVGDAGASPAGYKGSCPVTIAFGGTIAVDRGPVEVTYRWVRSDGATGPVETISFSGSGTQRQKVGTTWTLGSPGFTYSGWEAIKLLTPTESTSNQAGFTISCTQPPGPG
ncbi:MAG TPA: hypothetical protein VFA46_15125 [Actinomycetes bacterium]|nr:hypothetical protein [Actinomycetes bacterium]